MMGQIEFDKDDISAEDLGRFIKFLMEHDYCGTFNYDGGCGYTITYDFAPYKNYGNDHLEWVKTE